MQKGNNSYRNILKGTAIFGGVQVINIATGIVRGKLVAMILGTAGMGYASIITSATTLVQQIAQLGLNVSAVRDISLSANEGDVDRVSKVVKAVRRVIFLTALTGLLFTVLASEKLSEWSFGSTEHAWAFVFVSIYVFFSILSSGENALLQGFRKLKSLALMNVAGGLCGLFIGVPLYYWWGIKGVVPAMIIASIVLFLFARRGTRQISLIPIKQNYKESARICRTLIIIGVMMTIGACLGSLANYSILGFIRYYGSISDVGLYNAANSITLQYCGLVFTAMATDYFPRLSGTIQDREITIQLVNQQTELVVLLLAPIATIIIVSAPTLIRLLLTEEFLPVVDLVRCLGCGVLFKGFCFPMGYLSVAKGDKVYFFLTEGIWTNLKTPLILVVCYYFWGLKGLGYGALLNSLVDMIVVQILTRWRYRIALNKSFYKMTFPLCIGTILCFLSSFVDNVCVSYTLMCIFLIFVSALSLYELNKRISVREAIVQQFKNKR